MDFGITAQSIGNVYISLCIMCVYIPVYLINASPLLPCWDLCCVYIPQRADVLHRCTHGEDQTSTRRWCIISDSTSILTNQLVWIMFYSFYYKSGLWVFWWNIQTCIRETDKKKNGRFNLNFFILFDLTVKHKVERKSCLYCGNIFSWHHILVTLVGRSTLRQPSSF